MKKYFKYIIGFSVSGVMLAFVAVGIAYAAAEKQWNSGMSILVNAGDFDSLAARTTDGNFVIASDGGPPALQKYDSSGTALWNGGSPVDITGYSNLDEVFADESGGVFVVHGGPSVSNSNIYLSHLNSSGTISWTTGPMDNISDFWPRGIYDGSGGAYVAWYNTSEQLYLTHIGSDGDVCDVATCGVDWNGAGSGSFRKLAMPTSTNGIRPEPRMTLSDSGSVIVPYTRGTLIDVVKISTSGSTVWGPVTISDSNFFYMAGSDGSDGLFVGYWHANGSDRELKVARIDSGGAFQVGSGAGGVIVKTLDTSVRNIYAHVSDVDGTGNFYLGWTETIVATGEEVSFVQKYNSSGAEQWTTGGVQLFPEGDGLSDFFEDVYLFNLPRNLVSDGTGGVIAALYTFGGAINSAVIGQRVDSSGNLDWGTSGFFLTDDTINDFDYVQNVVSDEAGGAVFSWHTDFSDVMAQYVISIANPVVSGGGGAPSGPSCTVFPNKIDLPATLEVSEQHGKPVVKIDWSQGRSTDSTAEQKIKVFTDFLSQEEKTGSLSLRDTFIQAFYEDILGAEGSDLAQKFENELEKRNLKDLENLICAQHDADNLLGVITGLMDEPDSREITLKFINELIALEDKLSSIPGYSPKFSAYNEENFSLPSENTFDDITVEIYRDSRKIYSEINPQSTVYLDDQIPMNTTGRVKAHNYFILTSTECDTKIGSIGKAYINPKVDPGAEIDVTADLRIRIKDGYTQLFRERLGALIEAARMNNKARFEGSMLSDQSDVLRMAGGDLARLDIRRDVFSYNKEEKELIKCGGILGCGEEIRDNVSEYFKDGSHEAELSVEVYDVADDLVYQTVITTDIFGEFRSLSLGQFLAGNEYSIKIHLKNEKFVLPKLSKVILNSAQPKTGGDLGAHLRLEYDKQFRFGNFDDSNDVIDRSDILVWGKLMAGQTEVWEDGDLDGINGINLLDVMTFQENWGAIRESKLEKDQISFIELAKIFGLTTTREERVTVPDWLTYLQQVCR